MRILFILFNLFVFTSCRARLVSDTQVIEHVDIVNTHADSVTNLRNAIAKFNEVQDSHIGYAGTPSEQYANYEALLKIATDKELIKLSKDTNYVVATYATFGLIERKHPFFLDVFRLFMKNDQYVKVMSGCSAGEDFVSNQLYFNYYNKEKYENYEDNEHLQNDKTLLRLDSMILASNNPAWEYEKQMYENRIYENDYLSLIERQAFEKDNIYAIEYLFKNNSSQYKDRIISKLKQYLKKDQIAPIYYDIVYIILLSYHSDELNLLLENELLDIQKEYGEDKMHEYKNMLLKK
ncbi:MAG: hypothetical protein RI922_1752 [Bacteroidota bacterium]|jgi:hypothetical protein